MATMILLTEAGPLLFGERWRGPLAKHFGVSTTTIHRWIERQPDKVGVELSNLLHDRHRAIGALINAAK